MKRSAFPSLLRPFIWPLICALVVAGCSLGPREDWAEAIRDGFETAKRAGVAPFRQSVSVKAIETNIRQIPKPLIARGEGLADFAAHRARLVETGGRKTQVIYDDLDVYLQRSRSSAGKGAKRWATFDFEREPSVDLDDNDRRMAVGAGLISPVLAVELLDGILTGSVEAHGTGRKAGTSATRYTARLAPDAAVTEIEDEDRKEGVLRLFETLGVEVDDFPVDVWVDAKDQVRAVRYVLRQQKDRVNAFELVVSWEFMDRRGSEAAPIVVPGRDETIRSGRFSDFVTELIRDFS